MRSGVVRKVGMRLVTVFGNMVLANSGFHTRNYLSENNLPFRCAPCALFAGKVLGRKYRFKVAPKILSSRATHISREGLGVAASAGICVPTFRDRQRGTARYLIDGTDRLFHNILTKCQITPHSVPGDRRLIWLF
jgi:hypothetical protein